jgi:hypothetical protein
VALRDMEAAFHIWRFFTFWTIWDVNLAYYPNPEALISRAVCRDGRHFPFDLCPAPGASQVLVPDFKASG